MTKSAEIQRRLLQLHRKHRDDPSRELDTCNVVGSLIEAKHGDINNSSAGLRRKNRFLQDLEREFCICLPDVFHSKTWTLDALVDFVVDRATKPKLNRRLALKRLGQERGSWMPLILFISLAGAALSYALSMPWRAVASAITVGAVLSLVRPYWAITRHYRSLITQLDDAV